MPQIAFSTDWLKKLSDPYSVLGVSVAADDRRVLKRYRALAKNLHPDSLSQQTEAEKQLATQLFSRLINPAYQKLKQEKARAETLAMLRFQVRQLRKQGKFTPKSPLASRLFQLTDKEADVFYEQAIAQLADSQYQALDQFPQITQQLYELNLVYLHLKMGDPFLTEKRTGIMPAIESKPVQYTPTSVPEKPPIETYARRHYERAQEYMQKSQWALAVQELRDAIKIEANRSDYYSLLGEAYLKQNLPGMAKVYFRQALKLNPQDPLASTYVNRLDLKSADSTPTAQPQRPPEPTPKRKGLFGLFSTKK